MTSCSTIVAEIAVMIVDLVSVPRQGADCNGTFRRFGGRFFFYLFLVQFPTVQSPNKVLHQTIMTRIEAFFIVIFVVQLKLILGRQQLRIDQRQQRQGKVSADQEWKYLVPRGRKQMLECRREGGRRHP